MSDEERDEDDPPYEGESEHEWMQRRTSPELQWLYLFRRLTTRVEANESRGGVNEEEAKRRAEETQRNMDFIVRQQAQFTADMQQLRESQARAEQRWSQTAEGIGALLAIAQLHDGQIAALEKTTTRLAESQAKTDAQMTETDRRMAETDERINALINTVERIISERRNGGQGL
jgi:predicted  nucleic acid-binding Zn-ribbon protein